jgi:hypothetical protein
LVCHVVCVADVLAKSVLPSAQKPPPHPEDHTASFQKLGIDRDVEASICKAVSARFSKVLELFGV